MSSGGSKPKEQEASEGEKLQAQVAKDQIAHYRSTYAPLEQTYAEEAGRDYSPRLAAQAGVTGSRGMTEALQVAAGTASPLDAANLSSGVTLGRVAGMAEGRRLSSEGMNNAVKVGLGATADASRSLSEAARLQTDSLIQTQQNKLEEAKTKAAGRAMTLAAVGQAAGTAAGYYGANKLESMQAAKVSSQLGSSRQGYSSAYLSGWGGPTTGSKR